MHRKAFPFCTVSGPLDPVPFGHLGLHGAIPRKCSQCAHSFEGSCLRAMDSLHRYLELDYGFCGIDGDTEPVALDYPDVDPDLEVPRKCSTCPYLRPDQVHGVVCTKDSDVWGHLSRSLDWGLRASGVVVPGAPGVQVTLRFVRLAAIGDDIGALREFRASNPNASLATGRALCVEVRASMVQPAAS
jgi:hypothetical protein